MFHGTKTIPFRDAIIRLAFLHVLDNTVLVLQLRFFYPYSEGAVYTSYINDPEIFAALLAVEMVAMTVLRRREIETRAKVDDKGKGEMSA